MNFLAHIYLTDGLPMETIGNFMADGIKGKKYLKYSDDIQRGILVHRWIDSYTDSHPIVKQSTKRLHAKYGHYSGVIVDIIYDHFLAKNWNNYHDTSLDVYIDDFYQLLQDHHHLLTGRIQKMMIPMMEQNWLLSYATMEGIGTVLYNMNIRTKRRVAMDKAIEDLAEHYEGFEDEFTRFFKELQAFVALKLEEL
ncbi:acyl carrier protein phosphodiesterase [uncultured Dokdonia sp.]|uniref:acyl carrier protein phosphodiesterase n=1 Tax=uncultured Dokdonia sp. TaxID=575653 RepID=UPI00261AED9B|nr:acyl carrier protein phosphodiesterase [uncultured Dokdonia sp.]